MADQYLLGHDLGTSGCKAALTDLQGRVLASAEHRYPVHYSPDGRAEQDPEDWWMAIVQTTRALLAQSGVRPDQVAGLSMSAQMVGTLPVDEQGRPLRRAMIWLDARAQQEAEYLRKKTGFDFIDGKAPSAKVRWLMIHEPHIYARTYKVLDCKDYLQHRMTGVYATDYTLAAATTYFNPWTRRWWRRVLRAMELPEEKLPSPVPSTARVGELTHQAAQELGLPPGTPVIAGGGDVPCAVVGSGAITVGRGHLCLGTSAWVFSVTKDFILDAEGVLPIFTCDHTTYALGGEMDNAGGCLKWFREQLLTESDQQAGRQKGMSIYQYMDHLAAQVEPGAEGLLFLPWIWGERSPVNDESVRGGFVNLGSNHTRAHMIRAILEGVGHHLRWILDRIEAAGIPQRALNVIGGGAVSELWLQILADVTGVKMLQVEGPLDACARGAAMTAAVGLGIYPDFAAVEKVIRLTGKEFTPDPSRRALYQRAYAAFRYLYPPMSRVGKGEVPRPRDRKPFSLQGALESLLLKMYVRWQMWQAGRQGPGE